MCLILHGVVIVFIVNVQSVARRNEQCSTVRKVVLNNKYQTTLEEVGDTTLTCCSTRVVIMCCIEKYSLLGSEGMND